MSAWPQMKLVHAPEPGARVRLDLNDSSQPGGPRVEADGFTLGYPVLDGDPTAVGSSYSYRTAEFTLRITGSKSEALSTQAALWRELSRPSSWLLFQLDLRTPPVWAKVFRSYSDAPLSLDAVYVDSGSGGAGALPDYWRIPVKLTAEALLYGERESFGPYTVTQAPSGTNPMRVVLPTIKGDAPANLRVTVAPDGTVVGSGSEWLVGCISGTADMDDPIVDIGTGDGFTAGSGTAAATSGAAYFNSSKRVVTIGTGANFLERLSGPLPAMPSGRYKVLLRCQADSVNNVARPYLFAFGQPPADTGDPVVYGTTTLLPVGDVDSPTTPEVFEGWVDLGDFSFPFGFNVPAEIADAPVATRFSLMIGTGDGTAGAVRIDALKFIPVGGRNVAQTTLLKPRFGHYPQGILSALWDGAVGTFDGDSETYWANDSTTGAFRGGAPELPGGFPVADPAQEQNVLLLMATDAGIQSGVESGATVVTSVDTEAEVTVSCHPRYLQIPGEAPPP